MYGGFALLDHSLLIRLISKMLFCCALSQMEVRVVFQFKTFVQNVCLAWNGPDEHFFRQMKAI